MRSDEAVRHLFSEWHSHRLEFSNSSLSLVDWLLFIPPEDLMLIALAILYIGTIIGVIAWDAKENSDRLSAVKLASAFSLIEAFVMLWFSIRPEAIEERIFSQIAASFHDPHLVVFAYAFSLVAYAGAISGVVFGSAKRKGLAKFFSRNILFSRAVDDDPKLRWALTLYVIGVVLYAIFLEKIGGLLNLWQQLGLRTTMAAGLGYYQAAYTLLITLSTALIYDYFARRRKWIFLALFIAGSLFILGSLGQRAPVAVMCFILLLIHHYRIKSFNGLINGKTLIVSIGLIVFMFAVVQYRHDYKAGGFFSQFEQDVVQRLGIIERQVVVIGYFSENDFWHGRSYSSILYAFIPRSLYPQKPPVDTGVYINEIRQGRTVDPPVPSSDVDSTSWPDGFLAGYMNFGIAGLIAIAIVSGYWYGFIYRVIREGDLTVGVLTFYGIIGFMGVRALSPLGIVQIGFPLAMISLVAVVRRFIGIFAAGVTRKAGLRNGRALRPPSGVNQVSIY